MVTVVEVAVSEGGWVGVGVGSLSSLFGLHWHRGTVMAEVFFGMDRGGGHWVCCGIWLE